MKDVLVDYRQHERNWVGTPTPESFLAKVKSALGIEPMQYSDAAAVLDGYRTFIAVCTPQNTEAIDYFANCRARYLRRATIHQSCSRLAGFRNLATSLSKGDYGRKQRGSFGGLGLARDVVALVLCQNPSPT